MGNGSLLDSFWVGVVGMNQSQRSQGTEDTWREVGSRTMRQQESGQEKPEGSAGDNDIITGKSQFSQSSERCSKDCQHQNCHLFHVPEAGSDIPYVAQDDLELLLFLPLSPDCWNYRYLRPVCLVYRVLGIKCRASRMPGKHSTPSARVLDFPKRFSQSIPEVT